MTFKISSKDGLTKFFFILQNFSLYYKICHFIHFLYIFCVDADIFVFLQLIFFQLFMQTNLFSPHAQREKCRYSKFFWSECRKIRTRKTPITDTFYVAMCVDLFKDFQYFSNHSANNPFHTATGLFLCSLKTYENIRKPLV